MSSTSIQLSPQKFRDYFTSDDFNQIFRELKFAVGQLSKEDKIELFKVVIKESSKATWDSKKETGKAMWEFSKRAFNKSKDFVGKEYNDYVKSGWTKYSEKVTSNTIKFGRELPGKIKVKAIQTIEDFKKLSTQEQIELLALFLIGLMVYSLSAGGLDAEGGIPDSDFMFGIGFHRNFLFHSVLIGLAMEIVLRSAFMIMEKSFKHLPENKHPAWERIIAFTKRAKGVTMSAMWIGIGVHLLKDSALIVDGFKPYVGIPVPMPEVLHQSLFAANGKLAVGFGIDEFRKQF